MRTSSSCRIYSQNGLSVSPLRKATGKKIREVIDELVINRWGTPRELLTDNGTEFVNKDLRAFAEEPGIAHSTIPPYHPQANPVERVNRVVKTMITTFLENDHREWDLHLDEFRFAYNTAFHTSLGTPAFLNLEREPRPIQAVRDRVEANVETEKTSPDKWTPRGSTSSAGMDRGELRGRPRKASPLL